MIRTIAAILGVLALAGCAAEYVPPEQPAFYLDMAHGGAKLDAAVAKLDELAIPTTRSGDTVSLVDPWGIGLKLSA